MTTPQDDVARQSHDTSETDHQTPVIPLRPGMTEPVRQPQAKPVDLARRRAEALRLSREENLSLREIGKRLGITKDTVSRDIKAARRDETQPADATPQAHDSGETSHATAPAPDGEGRDTLVLVLDEPLRQALAVLRATQGAPDTPKQNRAAARAAIRSMADHFEEQART